MPTQTYCTESDIESILGRAGLLRVVDDNEDGVATSGEAARADDAISQAASQMNMYLGMRYNTATLANNEWCRWCNAYLAVQIVTRRRMNPGSPTLEAEAERYREWLENIRDARQDLPDAAPQFDPTPAVGHPVVDMRRTMPIRDRHSTSMRPSQDGVRRFPHYPDRGDR